MSSKTLTDFYESNQEGEKQYPVLASKREGEKDQPDGDPDKEEQFICRAQAGIQVHIEDKSNTQDC